MNRSHPMQASRDSGAIKLGEVVGGKYRVDQVLGSGGMGVVVSATHIDLNSRVALKILKSDGEPKPSLVARFVREARAVGQLNSEHTVRVLDVGRLPSGLPFMVMELLQGQTLAEILESNGPFPVMRAVDCILQVCEAIAEAHSHGIVHRDIKPQNLFLTRNAEGEPFVKVLDFGLAKSLEPAQESQVLTGTRAIMGSPLYMSPEQLKNARDVGRSTDIWSLGVCLYELVTGRTPFDESSLPELCANVLRGTPHPLNLTVPEGPALEAAILRCLAKGPADRFPNVAQLAWALVPFGPSKSSSSATRVVEVLGSIRPGPRPPPSSRPTQPLAVTNPAVAMPSVFPSKGLAALGVGGTLGALVLGTMLWAARPVPSPAATAEAPTAVTASAATTATVERLAPTVARGSALLGTTLDSESAGLEAPSAPTVSQRLPSQPAPRYVHAAKPRAQSSHTASKGEAAPTIEEPTPRAATTEM